MLHFFILQKQIRHGSGAALRADPSCFMVTLPGVDPKEAHSEGREGNTGHILPARPPWPPPRNPPLLLRCGPSKPGTAAAGQHLPTESPEPLGPGGGMMGGHPSIHHPGLLIPAPRGSNVPWAHLPLLPWDMPTRPQSPHSRSEETIAQGAGYWTPKPSSQHSCTGQRWAGQGPRSCGERPQMPLCSQQCGTDTRGSYRHCWYPSA